MPSEVSVLGDHKIVKVSAGANHSVAKTSTGLVFSWGSRNQVGLSNQTLSQVNVPRIVLLSTRGTTAAICSGNFHTMLVSSSGCMHFKYLLETMVKAEPSVFHDSYVSSSTGKFFWINSESLRSCVGETAWESFFEPQLKVIDGRTIRVSAHVQKGQENKEQENFDISNDPIDTILDDWVRDSTMNSGIDSTATTPDLSILEDGLPEIPNNCLFSSLSDEVIGSFFMMVYTDGVPAEGDWSSLLRLGICSQIERPSAILEKRIKKNDRDRTYLDVRVPSGHGRIDKAIRRLWNKDGDVVIQCGPPVHVDVLSRKTDDTMMSCHSFMIESFCPKLMALASNTSASIGQTIHLPYIPIDVMREIMYFAYFSEFDYSVSAVATSDLESVVKVWISVASFGAMCGSVSVHASALDRIVSVLGEDNWETIGLIVAKYDSVSNGTSLKQIREAVLAIGTRDVVNRVMRSKSFNAVNTYMYTKSELPTVVTRVMFELGIALSDGESTMSMELQASVTGVIESHLHIARTLRAELEKYREMNADPLADEIVEDGVMGTVRRYMKSFRVSHKEGPSVVSAMRDAAIFVAMIAIAMAYMTTAAGGQTWLGQTKIAKFVAESSVLSKAGILGTNLTFIAVVIYLVYKGIGVRF
jgi:hypothetical protein